MKLYSDGTMDSRIRKYLPVKRILWTSKGELLPENTESLLTNSKIQAHVNTSNPCIMKPGSSILLDFGKELHGGIRITTNQTECGTVNVRVRFGESVSEAMSKPNNDHAIHDSIVKLPQFGMTEFGNTGFRFVRIDIPRDVPSRKIEILGVTAVAIYRDLKYTGSFKSNDERLNKIWQTGAYTVHLNMQDYIYDGIKRDRLVWVGDLHPENRVICAVFDDKLLIPKSLDFVRDRTPLPAFMNNISSYSLWWIINQHDWFWHNGDIEYLKKQASYLTELLSIMAEYVDENGREQLPATRFLDWNSAENPLVIHAGLQGLMLWAFKAGKYLCSVLGDKKSEAVCADIITRMLRYNPPAGMSKTANAFKIIAGICDPATVNAEILAKDELSGLSTFLGYYVLQARALAGDYRGALDVIRKYWGAMLDFGATTFWEDFNLKWIENASPIDQLSVPGKDDLHADFGAHCYKGLRHSLCHGWAGGPTAWLSEHVLGVKILEPGAKTISVKPQLGNLKTVEGTFPTVNGKVHISARKNSAGKIITDVQAPPQIKIYEYN